MSMRQGLWKGRVITFRPGKLTVAVKRGVPNRDAYNALVENGCHIDYQTVSLGVIEVSVPPDQTLQLAASLGTNELFRYVEPDIMDDKENRD